MQQFPDDILRYEIYPFLEKEDIELGEEASGVSADWVSFLQMSGKDIYNELTEYKRRDSFYVLTISLDTADGFIIENLLSDLTPEPLIRWIEEFLKEYSYVTNIERIRIGVQQALQIGESSIRVSSPEDYNNELRVMIGTQLSEISSYYNYS